VTSGALVGIDLVEVADVRRSLAAHGARYLDRIYTARELREASRTPARLAARLAAKEATMKVLRTADEPLPWHSIALHDGGSGAPALELTGAASELAHGRAIRTLSVSVSRIRDSVCAVVLADCGDGL
jgi:holo-[acyl-carrier protein] synthase